MIHGATTNYAYMTPIKWFTCTNKQVPHMRVWKSLDGGLHIYALMIQHTYMVVIVQEHDSHMVIIVQEYNSYMVIRLWVKKWVCEPIYTHTKPGGRLKWSYAKSPGWQPTLCVTWCLICWFALAYIKYGHTWHWMSLLRPGVIKQHKPNQTYMVIIVLDSNMVIIVQVHDSHMVIIVLEIHDSNMFIIVQEHDSYMVIIVKEHRQEKKCLYLCGLLLSSSVNKWLLTTASYYLGKLVNKRPYFSRGDHTILVQFSSYVIPTWLILCN